MITARTRFIPEIIIQIVLGAARMNLSLWSRGFLFVAVAATFNKPAVFVNAVFDVSKDRPTDVPNVVTVAPRPTPSPPSAVPPHVESNYQDQSQRRTYYYYSTPSPLRLIEDDTPAPVYNTRPSNYYPSYDTPPPVRLIEDDTPEPVYNTRPSYDTPRPVYNSRPSYYYPSYDTPPPVYNTHRPSYSSNRRPSYYSSRSSPTNEPEESIFEAASTHVPVLIVVVIMFILSLTIVICGWDRGGDEIKELDNPEEAIQAFREELFRNKYLSFTLRGKTVSRRYALFFTTRIKRKWKPVCANVQFVMGWLSFFTSVIGLFAPDNAVNSVLGCGAMFVSEVVVHVWYGYFRYPNVASWCGFAETDTKHFDRVKEYSALLYHGGKERREDKRIDYVGFIPTLVFHFSSLFFIIVLYVAVHSRQNNNNNDGVNILLEALFPILVWLGAILGGLIYPLCFLVITNPALKIVAPILHHIAQEYYEAKLFDKDLNHLSLSIFLKFFGETFFPVLDEPLEFAAELKEEFNDLEDNFDIKKEDENNTTRNDSDSNEDSSDTKEEEENNTTRHDSDSSEDNSDTKEEDENNTTRNDSDGNEDNSDAKGKGENNTTPNDSASNKDNSDTKEEKENDTTRNDSDSKDHDENLEEVEANESEAPREGGWIGRIDMLFRRRLFKNFQ